MTILLGGGGDSTDEWPVFERFTWLTQGQPISYWPVALGDVDYRVASEWVESALGRSVSTWERLADHSPQELEAQAGVFIGGGNTFRLLHEIRRAGMSAALRSVAEHGVVYGGSAGAIILGADIGTASLSDRDDVGMFDLAGLGTVGRYAVWCHFEHDQLDAVLAWVRASGRPVLALTERSGAEIVGSGLSSIGLEPLFLVDERGDCSEVGDGETRSLRI